MNIVADYKKQVVYLILLTFIARCVVGSMVELGNDEVYYYTYALQPDWNHFDHPPMVGWVIRLFTFNLHWLSDLSMRLAAIVSCAIATWLIYLCGKLIRNERTGWLAALFYNLSVYSGIISGLFILPDSPQMVFWLASMYVILQLIVQPETKSNNRKLLLLGLLIGLTVMSKVHGIFLWLGFGGYILFHKRSWLKNPFLYLSVLITAIIISPILFWNIQHDFITFKFHGERVEVKKFAIDINSFLQTFIGQILYNNPLIIVLYILAFIQLKKSAMPKNIRNIFLWLSLPIIFLTTAISLFRNTLPHWSGPGFTALMLLTAWIVDESNVSGKNIFSVLTKISAGVIITALIAGVIVINFYPGTFNPGKDIKDHGRHDFTLDMYGWKQFGKEFLQKRAEDIRQGKMPADAPLVVENWFPAAHLLFYATKNSMDMKAIGDINRLHKFAWLNTQQQNIPQGTDAYYIAVSNFFIDPYKLYADLFTDIQLSNTLVQNRNGAASRYFFIYHLKNAKSNIVLPRPQQINNQK